MKSVLSPLALALLAAPLAAQEPASEQRLKDLERKVEILSRELETQKTGSAIPAAAEKGVQGLAPAASKVYTVKSGLSIGGYGEMAYENFAAKLEDGTYSPKHNTVDFVRQILYLGYKFNDWIVFNSEIEWEHGKASGEQTVTKTGPNVTDVKQKDPGEVSVEFAYLDLMFSKGFNLRAGMMLVPMGFTNELHEPPTFLGVKRPFTEQQIIPTTWRENGVGVHGEAGPVSYRVYVMNGLDGSKFGKAGIRGARQNGGKAVAESLAFVGRVDMAPLPGFTFGASVYNGNSAQNDNTTAITTRIVEGHAEYRFRGLQTRALYALQTNSEEGLLAASATVKALGKRQFGGYMEAGFDVLSLTGSKHALIPFLRWERLNTQQDVVTGVTRDLSLDQTYKTFGLVYKPIPQVAFKADFQKATNGKKTGRDQFNLGVSYYF